MRKPCGTLVLYFGARISFGAAFLSQDLGYRGVGTDVSHVWTTGPGGSRRDSMTAVLDATRSVSGFAMLEVEEVFQTVERIK